MHFTNRRPSYVGVSGDPLDAYSRLLRSAISSTNHPDKDWLLGTLRARRWADLLEWADRPSPQMYDSDTTYFVDCQLAALVRKYPFTPYQIPKLDPEATALKKFLSAEHRCKWLNRKFSAKRKRFDEYAQAKAYMRSFIEKMIGSSPDLQSIYDRCDFTSGASIQVNGNTTSIARKIFAQRWTVTPSALPYVIPALWSNFQIRSCVLPGAIVCYDREDFGRRVKERIEYVNYNNVSFVPKTAKTHRSIAVEPLLNGFIQKGIDEVLRAHLRRGGFDLSDQSRNQALAREGSLGGFNPFVTIDLSSASDSISTELVRDLLPPDWFELLSCTRVPQYMVPGTSNTVKYEKFCSMGNGFCFPLQTLIFASVCDAAYRLCGANRGEISVYGDDIIVRQSEALLVIELLKELGFVTNRDKTFVTGPFRESCGADWFGGQDVRPVHFDKPLLDVRECFALHNSTLRSPRCESFFEDFRETLRGIAGGDYLRPGREPGDTAYSVPLDLAMTSPNVRWRRDYQCWQWKEIQSLPCADPGRLGEEELAKALMLAAVRGHKSTQPFSLRYNTTPKIVRTFGPYFNGYLGTSEPLSINRRKMARLLISQRSGGNTEARRLPQWSTALINSNPAQRWA